MLVNTGAAGVRNVNWYSKYDVSLVPISVNGRSGDDDTTGIGDVIWVDNGGTTGTAGNGIQDGDEAGLANATVYICDGTVGTCDASNAVATTTTDANGAYLFEGLTESNYTVSVDMATLPGTTSIINDIQMPMRMALLLWQSQIPWTYSR